MKLRQPVTSRRGFGQLALGAAFFAKPGSFAEQLELTPGGVEGPFYPNKLPLDTDNDLLIINDGIKPGVGTITHLSGRVLDPKGSPLRNAVVELWQVDGNGVYLHSGSDNGGNRDPHFQGYGRFLTGAKGEYYFRTVRPVPYPGRTPHFHVIVKRGERKLLTTQLYLGDQKSRNEQDALYRHFDPRKRPLVTVDFEELEGSRIGEITGEKDLVVHHTPDDEEAR